MRQMECGNYAVEQKKEEEIFENAVDYIEVATNKKPYIEVLKYSDRTESTMKITAMAADEDGEALTYKLYVGTTKDSLVEQTEVKEKVEQGTEVEWIVPVIDSTITYYYKVMVKDRYATIESEIKETNNAPVLAELNMTKDLDEETGNNWLKVTARATDLENDKLTYTLKMWKKNEGANETELIAQVPTKTETKVNVTAGQQVEIQINGLEEYQDYIYRMDVADQNNMTIGEAAVVKTYCSGKGIECEGEICDICEGTGWHYTSYDKLHTASNLVGWDYQCPKRIHDGGQKTYGRPKIIYCDCQNISWFEEKKKVVFVYQKSNEAVLVENKKETLGIDYFPTKHWSCGCITDNIPTILVEHKCYACNSLGRRCDVHQVIEKHDICIHNKTERHDN